MKIRSSFVSNSSSCSFIIDYKDCTENTKALVDGLLRRINKNHQIVMYCICSADPDGVISDFEGGNYDGGGVEGCRKDGRVWYFKQNKDKSGWTGEGDGYVGEDRLCEILECMGVPLDKITLRHT